MTDPFEDLVELRRRWGGRTPPPTPPEPEVTPFNPRIEGRKRLVKLREMLEASPEGQSEALLVFWEDAARAFAALLQMGATAPEPADELAISSDNEASTTGDEQEVPAADEDDADEDAVEEEEAEAEEAIEDPQAMLTEALDHMEELLEAFGMK